MPSAIVEKTHLQERQSRHACQYIIHMCDQERPVIMMGYLALSEVGDKLVLLLLFLVLHLHEVKNSSKVLSVLHTYTHTTSLM